MLSKIFEDQRVSNVEIINDERGCCGNKGYVIRVQSYRDCFGTNDEGAKYNFFYSKGNSLDEALNIALQKLNSFIR